MILRDRVSELSSAMDWVEHIDDERIPTETKRRLSDKILHATIIGVDKRGSY